MDRDSEDLEDLLTTNNASSEGPPRRNQRVPRTRLEDGVGYIYTPREMENYASSKSETVWEEGVGAESFARQVFLMSEERSLSRSSPLYPSTLYSLHRILYSKLWSQTEIWIQKRRGIESRSAITVFPPPHKIVSNEKID